MPIDTYPVGLKNIDIGCCPLSLSRFNLAKTPIKAMEYAATGAAVVASPTLYGKLVEDCLDGFICETPDQWTERILQLVDDGVTREIMARRLMTKVRRELSLEGNAWRWLDAWTSIVNETRERAGRKILVPAGAEVNHANAG
jgi:glycosyltransferase involved in cell wall biosynthesis